MRVMRSLLEGKELGSVKVLEGSAEEWRRGWWMRLLLLR